MNIVTEIDKIEEQLQLLRQRKHQAEIEQFENEVLPELTRQVGATWKYNNSDGQSRFSSFRKLLNVILADRFGWRHAYAVFLQIDCNADRYQMEVTKDLISPGTHKIPLDGWKPCPAAEFHTAYLDALDEFATGTLIGQSR